MAFDAHSIIHEVMDDGHSHGHAHAHLHEDQKPQVEAMPTTVPSSGSSTTITHDHVHDNTCTESHHTGTASGSGSLSPKSAIVLLAAMSVHRYVYTITVYWPSYPLPSLSYAHPVRVDYPSLIPNDYLPPCVPMYHTLASFSYATVVCIRCLFIVHVCLSLLISACMYL